MQRQLFINILTPCFINTSWHNRVFKNIYNLDMAQSGNEFDTSDLQHKTRSVEFWLFYLLQKGTAGLYLR